MGYVLDLAVAAVIVVFLLIGRRRGAIRTVVELCGLAVAIVAAVALCGVLSDWIYSSMIRGSVIKSVESALGESAGQGAAAQLERVLGVLPGFVLSASDAAQVSASVTQAIAGGVHDGAVLVADQVVRPVTVALLRIVLAVVLTVLILLLIHALARLLDLIARLPVLHQLNRLLGALLGAAKGVVVVLLALAVLRIALPMREAPGLFSPENLEQSILFGAMYEHNPLYAMLENKP